MRDFKRSPRFILAIGVLLGVFGCRERPFMTMLDPAPLKFSRVKISGGYSGCGVVTAPDELRLWEAFMRGLRHGPPEIGGMGWLAREIRFDLADGRTYEAILCVRSNLPWLEFSIDSDGFPSHYVSYKGAALPELIRVALEDARSVGSMQGRELVYPKGVPPEFLPEPEGNPRPPKLWPGPPAKPSP